MAEKREITFLRKLDKLANDHTLLFLAIFFLALFVGIVIQSSLVLERAMIVIITLVVFLGVFFLIAIRSVCLNSSNPFFRKNSFFFQLLVAVFISIYFGAIITSAIYSPDFPYPVKLILVPYDYLPSNNIDVGFPFVFFTCSQRNLKNFVDGEIMNCKIEDFGAGWSGTKINRVEIFHEGQNQSMYPDGQDSVSFRFSKNKSYSVKAYYGEGKFINSTLFENEEVRNMVEYEDLKLRKAGLIGVFVVFSLSILTSFLKNVIEIVDNQSETKILQASSEKHG